MTIQWDEMAELAWLARDSARLALTGKTKVGCAVLTDMGSIHTGCNVEHRYRSHDIHAEVNALSSMVDIQPGATAVAVLIAAERDSFTPCGACMDWIFELGGPATLVTYRNRSVRDLRERPWPVYRASQLMPFYPV